MQLPSDLTVSAFDGGFRLRPDEWRWAAEAVAAEVGLAVTAFSAFSDGSNLVAAIDGRHVVKIFPPFHRYQWESERRVLAHLQGHLTLPIPALVGVGERPDGWTWLALGLLPGTTLEPLWPTCAHADRVTILRAIGRTMREVHALPPGPVADLDPPWAPFIAGQIERAEARHRRLGAPDWVVADLPALLRDVPLPDGPPVLLTGEYTPFNLLARPDAAGRLRLSGMIDFADAMVGPAEYDLLGPSLFLCGGDPALTGALFEGYGRPFDAALRRQLMLLALLHRYSNLRAQLRLAGWQDAGDLDALAARIWPLPGAWSHSSD